MAKEGVRILYWRYSEKMDIGAMANDLYQGYRALQYSHPLIGSMITAEVVFPLADLISQLIEDRKVDMRKLRYTALLAPVYGLCLEGLIGAGELVGEYISPNPVAKGALGPNLWGNLVNAFFFVNNTVGEKKKYSVRELVKHYYGIFSYDSSLRKGVRGFFKNLKEKTISNIPGREYLYATMGTLTAWNIIHGVNYAFIPAEMRTSFMQACLLVWIPTLSWLSLKGRRKLVDREKMLAGKLED